MYPIDFIKNDKMSLIPEFQHQECPNFVQSVAILTVRSYFLEINCEV